MTDVLDAKKLQRIADEAAEFEDKHGALVLIGPPSCVECVALQLSTKTFRICSLCGRVVSPTTQRREPRKTRSYTSCR